jgi:hypothetical protein
LKKSLAAALLSTAFHITKQPGLIARADLSHFYSCLVFVRDFFNQLTKIHPSVRHKIEDDSLAAKYVLGIDYLHRQIKFFDETPATFYLFFRDLLQMPFFAYISGGRVTDEFTGLVDSDIYIAVIEIFFYLLAV